MLLVNTHSKPVIGKQRVMPVFLSFIIPTIGRPTITRAIESILDAQGNDHGVEIIVVNDSGSPLSPTKWQSSELVRIIDTNQRERCYARNAGAAVARGNYLGFLDDDDWLLPSAISAYWELSQQEPEAVWLYGGVQVVDEHGARLAEMNSGLNGDCFAQIMGGAWAPIQSSCIRTEAFFRVGGYRTDILGTEDLDLCRRIAHSVAWRTPAEASRLPATWRHLEYLYQLLARARRHQTLPRCYSGRSRGFLAPDPDCGHSGYWYGRILRIYLSTITWNLRRKQYLRAFSRCFYSLGSLALSGRHLGTKQYWEGVKAQHVPGTLHFFMESVEHDRLNHKRNQHVSDS
jgi:glycosyltransferase involved in cell wall biosynthesis